MKDDENNVHTKYQKEDFEKTIMSSYPKARRNIIFMIPLLILAILWYFHFEDILLLIIIGVLFIMQLNIVVMGTIINKSASSNEPPD